MVFVGRSNSGKSSLLNKVFDVKLARVAKRAVRIRIKNRERPRICTFLGLRILQGSLLIRLGMV